MCTTKKIADRRDAFTLVEMLVVIAIILALAALAAAFAPRVSDNQRMTRAVDNLEQWLLTAKMRAKRDGLSTGIRFIPDPNDLNPANPRQSLSNTYSQFQYIQQPAPLAGGTFSRPFLPPPFPPDSQPAPPPFPPGTFLPPGVWVPAPSPPFAPGMALSGGYITSANSSTVTFGNVDFSLSMGTMPQVDAFGRQQWLVQTGDLLEINGGGVFNIVSVVPPLPNQPAVTLQLGGTATYFPNLIITAPTTNYRIIRQPRILIGEEPLTLPNNYAANFNAIPGYLPATFGCNVAPGLSGYYEILFSPTGAVVGTNSGNSTIVISVWDTTMDLTDPNASQRVGIVGVQSRTGFIGAYNVSLGPLPFYFVQTARESGM